MESSNRTDDSSRVGGPVDEGKKRSLRGKIEGHIQSRTMRGFLELIPLLVTIFVLLFLIGHADSFVRSLPIVQDQPWDFTGIGLIVLRLLFYVVGIIDSKRPGRKFMQFKDTVFSHIPVVKLFYGVTKQAIQSLTSPANFTRVVFIEWPREGMVAMGFVTGRVYSQDKSESMVVVYIPTVPNPTSGNMAFVVEDDVIETDLTVDAAMKLVFSGGIVLPEVVSMARVPRTRRDDGTEMLGQYRTLGVQQPKSQEPSS